ncbi:hypothetical protein L1049_027940 [Liquidambar formosana]|uniref:Uncharacterized protein n=1 Tax=Liquidambar formosana TaxID=63359 RepID=A0AAP0RK27_LIQFO
MKRALLRSLFLCSRNLLSPSTFKPNPNPSSPIFSLASTRSELRFYSSSQNNSSNKNPKPVPDTNSTQPNKQDASVDVEEVPNQELKLLIEKYSKGDDEVFPSIFEAILKRRLAGKREETVDELMKEIQHKPLRDIKDKDFESDVDELFESDEESEDL